MYKGEDKIVEIALTDENDDPIDPAGLDGLIVVVYEQSGQIIEQFSKEAHADFEDIQNINSVAGTFEIFLKRSVFKKYLRKTLKGEVKIAETNADFEDGIFESIAQFEIDPLKDSETANIPVPT